MMATDKNKERDRKQREAAHAARHLEHHRFQRNVDPQRRQDRGNAERIGDGHSHQADEGETADQNEDGHRQTLNLNPPS
jgi:hypothetical protein